MSQVLFICYDDLANVGYGIVQGLRSVGESVRGVKYVKHLFDYPKQLPVIKKGSSEFISAYRGADTIVFMHSDFVPRYIEKFSNKSYKTFGFFTGDNSYRNNSKEMNEFFKGFTSFSLFQTYDLTLLGATNPYWYIPPIDTELLQPVNLIDDGPLKIAHFPNIPANKNPESVLRVIDRLKQEGLSFTFMYDYTHYGEGKIRTWEQNIAMLSLCDVYIESQSYIREGKPFGAFGITGMEASALGKVVITVFRNPDEYTQNFGVQSEIIPSNSEEELYTVLKNLILSTKDSIRNKAQLTRKWIEGIHSYKPSGLRLKEILYNHKKKNMMGE
jgi:hypothetical protein